MILFRPLFGFCLFKMNKFFKDEWIFILTGEGERVSRLERRVEYPVGNVTYLLKFVNGSIKKGF